MPWIYVHHVAIDVAQLADTSSRKNYAMEVANAENNFVCDASISIKMHLWTVIV